MSEHRGVPPLDRLSIQPHGVTCSECSTASDLADSYRARIVRALGVVMGRLAECCAAWTRKQRPRLVASEDGTHMGWVGRRRRW